MYINNKGNAKPPNLKLQKALQDLRCGTDPAPLLTFKVVWEYLTSQVCHLCHYKFKNAGTSDKVMRCATCKCNIQRDQNSSLDILELLRCEVESKDRPSCYCPPPKPAPDTPLSPKKPRGSSKAATTATNQGASSNSNEIASIPVVVVAAAGADSKRKRESNKLATTSTEPMELEAGQLPAAEIGSGTGTASSLAPASGSKGSRQKKRVKFVEETTTPTAVGMELGDDQHEPPPPPPPSSSSA